MTDKDIIKALKHCYEHKSCNDCVGCLGVEECILNVDPAGDIYPIINRQQAEIEKLNVELVGMRGACNSYKMHYDNARAEIERLEKELSTANNHITRLESQIERLLLMLKTKRAEAIREFADRLKGTVDLDTFGKLDYAISIHDVDNLVKEWWVRVSE
jgi:DNA repair exonuclease SbcCD ATPase subunit